MRDEEAQGSIDPDQRRVTHVSRGGMGREFLFPVIVIGIATVLMIGYFFGGWRVRPSGLATNPPPGAPDIGSPTESADAPADKAAGSAARTGEKLAKGSAANGGKKAFETPGTHQPGIGIDRLFGNHIEVKPSSVAPLIEESKQVVACVAAAFPGDPDASEIAARLYFRLGETNTAEEAWNRCLKLNPKFVYAYHGLGRAAAKRGDDKRAIQLFRKALAIDPNAYDVQIDLGQTLIDANQMKPAIELLDENVKHDPRRHRGYVLLGMAYMQLEDYQRAKTCYQAALDAFPQHANACFGLASACVHLGETEEAKKQMARFRKLRTEEREIGTQERSTFDDLGSMCVDTAASYAAAARVCHVHQYPTDTRLLCLRAAALDPKNTDCRQALAWLDMQSGRLDRTIQTFRELMQLEPENMHYPLQIATIYASMGQPLKGERFLRDVTESAPENAAAYVALANFLLKRNTKLSEAVALAHKATRLDKSPANYVLLSTALEKTGDIPGAIEALSVAVQRAPNNPRYQKAFAAIKKKYQR